jgi:hypothetical protein
MRSLILAAFFLASGAPLPDTAQLARHLRAVRTWKVIPPQSYEPIQAEYLAWIDARVKAHESIKDMAAELQAAGILAKHPSDPSADMDRSYVGYFEPPSESQIHGAEDLFEIDAEIYKNANCGLNVTPILYDRRTLARLGWLNGEPQPSEYPYYLSSLAIAEEDASGSRIIASGWVISNCTSTWNGKSIRIDRMDGKTTLNLLSRSLWAHDRESPTVASWVRGETVTFFYDGGVPDADLLETPSIARYRIANGRAIHVSPIALTRAGFIQEWLTLDDIDPADYAAPEAVAARAKTARDLRNQSLEWQSVTRCPGTPPIWEIAVQTDKPPRTVVFRIAGERATQLRMISIGNRTTPSCARIDISKNLGSVGSELPW